MTRQGMFVATKAIEVQDEWLSSRKRSERMDRWLNERDTSPAAGSNNALEILEPLRPNKPNKPNVGVY